MEFLSPEWWAALLAIVIVDLLLAGDNAVVIALAARNLPAHLKRRAVIWGTMGAIIIRVILVFFVSKLLLIPGISFVGGLLLYAIAWKLINDDGGDKHENQKAAAGFWSAMRTIIVADTVMGLDNIIAIAGAARGDIALIIFGLGLSIPIMMGGAALLLKLMERAPWLVIVGAALLSGIAGRIVIDDKWFREYVEMAPVMEWVVILALAAVATAAAVLWKRRRPKAV